MSVFALIRFTAVSSFTSMVYSFPSELAGLSFNSGDLSNTERVLVGLDLRPVG